MNLPLKGILMKLKIFSTIILFATIFCLYLYQPIKKYQGFAFGTYYNISVISKKNVSKDIASVIENINNQLSIFQKDSQINKLNSSKQISASKELIEVLSAAQIVWQQSNGYFDPSVGTLVELWGFGKNNQKSIPSANKINEVLEYSSFGNIKINGATISKSNIKTNINLSAIAKGYAVDKIAEALDARGISNYLINIGGEIKAKGSKKGTSWKIGLANPSSPSSNDQVFELNNMSVATSGDYQNFFIQDAQKFSHTINPKTGYPTKNTLASATVFHPSCMMADAYATAIMAMGKEKGEDFAKKNGLKVILIEY